MARSLHKNERFIGLLRRYSSRPVKHLFIFLFLTAILAFLYEFLGVRWVSTGTVIGIWAITVVGLEILWGYAGQISLGHGGFIAIGAYSTAVLTVNYGFSPLSAMAVGMLLSCAIAYLLGKLVLSLDELYLGLATLGFGLVTPALIVGFKEFTNGAVGIYGIPQLSIGSFTINNDSAMYITVWGLAMLGVWGTLRLRNSRTGLSWKVLAHHPMVATACGVDVSKRKMDALLLSSVLASVSGSLFAHYSSTVTPGSFAFSIITLLLTIQIVGGLGTGYGAIVGAILMNLVLTYSGQTKEFSNIVFGGVFLVILLAAPIGVVGWINTVNKRLMRSRPLLQAEKNPTRQSFQINAPFDVTFKSDERTPHNALADVVMEFKDISIRFGGIVANEEVSFKLGSGQIHGIVGPNGAGKTTLVNIATGIYTPDSGTLIWKGEMIHNWSAAKRARSGIARTFQTPSLVPELSVLENVTIGAYRFGKQGIAMTLFMGNREMLDLQNKALEQLEVIGLRDIKDKLAGELSFGQRRLVELARALTLSPQLLFLDEPMSGLDSQEKQHVSSIILKLRDAGTAICLIEHDTEIISALCDWVTVLDFGRVLAEGPHGEVFQDDRVRASYMGDLTESKSKGEVDGRATQHA